MLFKRLFRFYLSKKEAESMLLELEMLRTHGMSMVTCLYDFENDLEPLLNKLYKKLGWENPKLKGVNN